MSVFKTVAKLIYRAESKLPEIDYIELIDFFNGLEINYSFDNTGREVDIKISFLDLYKNIGKIKEFHILPREIKEQRIGSTAMNPDYSNPIRIYDLDPRYNDNSIKIFEEDSWKITYSPQSKKFYFIDAAKPGLTVVFDVKHTMTYLLSNRHKTFDYRYYSIFNIIYRRELDTMWDKFEEKFIELSHG